MGAGASSEQLERADQQSRVSVKSNNMNENNNQNKGPGVQSKGNNSDSAGFFANTTINADKTENQKNITNVSEKTDSANVSDKNNTVNKDSATNSSEKGNTTKSTASNANSANTTKINEENNATNQPLISNTTTSKPTSGTKNRVVLPKTLNQSYEQVATSALDSLPAYTKLFDTEYPNGNMEKIFTAIHMLRRLYSSVRNAPPEYLAEYRKKLAMKLTEHGKFSIILAESVVKIINGGEYYTSDIYTQMDNCNSCLLNYSDCSDLFRKQFGQQDELVKMMSDKLLEWAPDHKAGKNSDQVEGFVKRFLGVAHNLAILPANVPIMRYHGYVKSCALYLDSEKEMVMLSALATLADILNEDECDLLKTNDNSIKFLLQKLSNASRTASRRDAGWSASELGRTVGRLARNDANKKVLVTLGVLPLLLALTNSEIKIEQEESIESLWVLAFNDENKSKMVSEPDLINTIHNLHKTSTVPKVRKLCNGILWTLRKTLNEVDKYKHIVKMFQTEPKKPTIVKEKTKVDVTEPDKGHVMISYQWDHQTVLQQVSASLRADKRSVWMDIDNMEGSTLQAMASAIEGAEVVVICMSQKYKDSPNCRAEAEYAFQLRKPIIPLKMEKGYQPDGWLGFILGAKLFYEFSGKYSYESRIDGLLKGVKQIYDPSDAADSEPKTTSSKAAIPLDEVDSPPIQKQVSAPVRSSPPHKEEDNKIKKWTPQEVQVWLKKHHLEGNSKLTKLTGKEVVFLKNLREEAPEFFYNTLENRLGLNQLNAIVDFSEALRDLG